ncbi:MAG TPA: 3' terminal RNA ribose 2'-O-methyltransferase Hen1 [Gryllotalpicola sp.]
MLITVTFEPDSGVDASALSHLLRKHPERVQTFTAPVGDIHVFYPEVARERCTVAMLLEVDPIALVRNKKFRGDAGALDHYVNDRPYVASSLLSVALGTVFRSAMAGGSATHPELAEADLPLRIEVPAISTRGERSEDLARRLFEPLGWRVDERPIPLDDAHPDWGASRYSGLTLTGRLRLAHALRQLYVLLPVLDDTKHYWVGDDEAAKLVRQGEGWLAQHPERELITRRYLAYQSELVARADAGLGASGTEEDGAGGRETGETPLRTARADAVIGVLREVGAHRVVDMGAGAGALLRRLHTDRTFTELVGVDVSARALETAARRLGLATASDAERERVRLLHGSAVYRDDRVRGFDAMVLMEVIEHVDESRLAALEDAVFTHARPGAVVVTTPNGEYNVLYASLPAGRLRHDDHRFEWTRARFAEWANGVAARRGYTVELRPVGPVDDVHGSPTQLALFRREDA